MDVAGTGVISTRARRARPGAAFLVSAVLALLVGIALLLAVAREPIPAVDARPPQVGSLEIGSGPEAFRGPGGRPKWGADHAPTIRPHPAGSLPKRG